MAAAAGSHSHLCPCGRVAAPHGTRRTVGAVDYFPSPQPSDNLLLQDGCRHPQITARNKKCGSRKAGWHLCAPTLRGGGGGALERGRPARAPAQGGRERDRSAVQATRAAPTCLTAQLWVDRDTTQGPKFRVPFCPCAIFTKGAPPRLSFPQRASSPAPKAVKPK